MLRSMYSGISGMKVNQTKLDVIGNNISNVNTTAFKSSRARFSDTLNQSVSDAMAPTNSQGGINASQVGLGVQLASIDSVMTQGNIQTTGRQLDVAIDGDGFFMVSKGSAIYGNSLEVTHRAGSHNVTEQSLTNSGVEMMYTRDGSFILDEQGNLLTGDGFRIMGYSLTNDDSAQSATGLSANTVTAAGFSFRFGPGSQLNGYKVVLGAIGPGTVTTAEINKEEKTIVLNGDFSDTGSLTAAQVESALNKGLSSAGISQEMYVSGKATTFQNLGSESVVGGSDALAPKAVTIGGYTVQLDEGSELNEYSFEIGEISTDPLEVKVERGSKKIVINGDFLNRSFNAEDLQDELNNVLNEAGFKQSAKITGTMATLSNIKGNSDSSGQKNKGAEIDYSTTSGAVANSVGGFTFSGFTNGELNDYKISIGEYSEGTTLSVVVEKGSIVINGDFTSTPASFTDSKLENKLKIALKAAGIKTEVSVNGSINSNAISNQAEISEGITEASPKSLNIANLTVELPKGEALNNLEFAITDINQAQLEVIYTPGDDSKGEAPKLEIKGDFTKKVSARNLQDTINAELAKKGLTDKEVTVSGTSKAYTGLTSDNIEGGEEDKSPSSVNVGGVSLTFTEGSAFNGYKFQLGNISAGTKAAVDISSTNKTITINGDFVTSNAITAKNIQDALTRALETKGIDQGITVSGTPIELGSGGVVSDETYGGTPVESLTEDGSVNFVDASKDLKAYDGQLKTLKIPDKVKFPGTDTELSVKTYTISENGVINGVLEDGRVAALGQIAMANFKNPEGLTKLGGNLYSASVNSGESIIKSGVGTLGDDNSQGYGDNLQGMLEMSNVDLSEQFTDMIVSNRAFQAAGKMITTGDEILQDIINLKR